MNKFQKKLWRGLLVLAVLCPLGIALPQIFNAGDAWGEWSVEQLRIMLGGEAPRELRRTADLWKAPVPDYNLGTDSSTMPVKVLSYAGIAIAVVVITFAVIKALNRNER